MNSLYLLIPIALVLIVLALVFLYWAINNGQYDDLDTESKRILFDNTDNRPPSSPASQINDSAPEQKEGNT